MRLGSCTSNYQRSIFDTIICDRERVSPCSMLCLGISVFKTKLCMAYY